MNNRKNYNSIVFLTTLSVYLGLALVGGGSQVWAQAALTRQFDVQAEIEVEDDLDKNPDEQTLGIYAATLENLFALARDFAENNREKLRGNDYEFDCSLIMRADVARQPKCQGGSSLLWGGFISPSLIDIANAFPHAADENAGQVRVNLILSDDEFLLKSSFTQPSERTAEKTSRFFDAALSGIKFRQSVDPQALIYERTAVSAENNQVFVVTRLPRASIDSLFARKDAR